MKAGGIMEAGSCGRGIKARNDRNEINERNGSSCGEVKWFIDSRIHF